MEKNRQCDDFSPWNTKNDFKFTANSRHCTKKGRKTEKVRENEKDELTRYEASGFNFLYKGCVLAQNLHLEPFFRAHSIV